jgi:hypothetical protein
MALTDKQSIYGPKNSNGSPGIGIAGPGAGGENSPDIFAKELSGGLQEIANDPKMSKYDLEAPPVKYHP